MRICKHCGVRIEYIQSADGHDRWMHRRQRYRPPTPPSIYLQCDLPGPVAEPHFHDQPINREDPQ